MEIPPCHEARVVRGVVEVAELPAAKAAVRVAGMLTGCVAPQTVRRAALTPESVCDQRSLRVPGPVARAALRAELVAWVGVPVAALADADPRGRLGCGAVRTLADRACSHSVIFVLIIVKVVV